ncbi:MAG: hypothetical protein WCA19_23495 [Candidatus Acidiferrales bacterium]
MHRPSRGENRAVALKHDKCNVLVGEPAERCERYKSVTRDYNQTAESVPNAGKPGLKVFRSNSVLDNQMPPFNIYIDPISKQSQNTMPESKRIAGL